MLKIGITNKIRSKRGVTLPEILIVVAIMIILLGIAAPNIFAEANELKFTHMNDNARAVAVAVQSKLYSIKNSGTSLGSEYANLNLDENSTKITLKVKNENGEEISKDVRYVCSWKDALAKQVLFSGAITDIKLLNKGYILMAYDPVTGDILRLYYSEKEFKPSDLFVNDTDPASQDKPCFKDVDEKDLRNNYIGKYTGYAAPEPQYKATLPRFSAEWVFDDEMYLQLTMVDIPADSLLDKPLGVEVFAVIPGGDYVMIYAEGFFATEYETQYAGTIKADYGDLTLRKINGNNNHLRFALDSLVMKKAGYGSAYPYLQHQTYPKITSMADDLLYPRNAVATWFDGEGEGNANPYLTVFSRESEFQQIETQSKMSDAVHDKFFAKSPVTDYVPINGSMSLTVRISVLSDTTRESNADKKGQLQNRDDGAYAPVIIESENMSPYFYALSGDGDVVTISSMRDYGNLSYVFNDPNSTINQAKLAHDISGQEFYDKLVKTRYAVINKIKNVSGDEMATDFLNNKWNMFSNRDTVGVDPMIIANRTEFTIDGAKPDGGNYAISNIEGGGRNTSPGGFFHYAENVTFKNIDIINPRSWRNNCDKDFLSDPHKIDLQRDSVVSGSLVGIAVNCQFENVHAYIDSSQSMTVEDKDGGLQGDLGDENKLPQNINERRIEGTVVGGLVGLAIGRENDVSGTGKTTFDNCSASVFLITGIYYAPSQCVYAGGLVGIAFGNVDIKNSYAASSLNGYYSGGLVGFATNGTWSYDYGTNIKREEHDATGTLSMDNSFAAGHINRLTRVGAGLIADYNYTNPNEKPKVTGCYSAVNWDALTPVAYGTFKGDTGNSGNYYVSQTDLSLPITANLEAHFKVTAGDVFSLQQGDKSGTPCTLDQLNANFKTKGWVAASSTSQWRWKETHSTTPKDPPGGSYPFLMPASNNKFWGDWITNYYSEIDGVSIGDPNAALNINFDRYICPFYDYELGWGKFPIHVNTGNIVSESYNMITLYTDTFEGKVMALVNGVPSDGLESMIQADLEDNPTIYRDPKTYYTYWAKGAIETQSILRKNEDEDTQQDKYNREMILYGQGIDGATKITLDATVNNYEIEGAPYYDPKYDPITGYSCDKITGYGFTPEGDGINLGDSQLSWDYYGFYCTAIYGVNPDAEGATDKYYIQFDNQMTGQNARIEGDFLYVNEEEFKKALNYYDKLKLPTDVTKLQLVWNNGYFQVQAKEA